MTHAQTLLDKAHANARTAQILLQHCADDDEQLNAIGYHLQQSLEFALKYLLEQDGVEYPKTHDIDQLVRLAHERDVELMLSDYLEDHAEMFSQWEAKSRYVLGYMIERRKVQRALAEVESYLNTVFEYEKAEIERLSNGD